MDFLHDLQKLGPGPLAAVIAALLGCFILVGAVYLWIVKSTRRARTNFSDEAQKAIGFARVEAEQLQSPTIDPTHLLLGLMHVPATTIQRLLPKEQHDSIRDEIKEHVAGGAIVSYRDDLPFSDDASHVLVAAAREARGLRSSQILAEHLLLGILHSDSLAALVLRERGLRLEPLRAQLGGWQE
jgi:ATP-dependent Clp protease ATP-binding subunit ClpA